MKREILCCFFGLAVFTPAAAREPILLCDSMCWRKALYTNSPSEMATLICKRVYRSDDEAAHWKQLVESGQVAVGKPMTVESADSPTPDPGGAQCQQESAPDGGSAYDLRVTGFAYQAKPCSVS